MPEPGEVEVDSTLPTEEWMYERIEQQINKGVLKRANTAQSQELASGFTRCVRGRTNGCQACEHSAEAGARAVASASGGMV